MRFRAILFALTALTISGAAQTHPEGKQSTDLTRDSIIHIVTRIQRADYEGDRAALKSLHDQLTPIPQEARLASRELYWRGFAMWRRAINGFNETPTPTDLEEDLNQGIADFKDSIARDPAFVDAKIGAGSSYGYLMYLHHKDQARVQELIQQSSPLLKECMAHIPTIPGCSGCSARFAGRLPRNAAVARIRRSTYTTKDWK
jgi:hypothetical protein